MGPPFRGNLPGDSGSLGGPTRLLARIRLWLPSLFERKHVERELNDEFEFHLERLVEWKTAAGACPPEAREAALRELGGVS